MRDIRTKQDAVKTILYRLRPVFLLCLCLSLLLIASCNRLKKTFEPDTDQELFEAKLEEFREGLSTSLNLNNPEPIMPYFADDYLFDGKNKDDVRDYFAALAGIEKDSLSVTIVSFSYASLRFSYRIEMYSAENNLSDYEVSFDTTLVEYCDTKEKDFSFIGNGQEEIIIPDKKVLIELFLSNCCGNAHYVESVLLQLKQQHGNNFYYIQYHDDEELNFGNAANFSYYGITTTPVGIVQGQTRIAGASAYGSLPVYRNALNQYFDTEAEITFTNFSYAVNEGVIIFNLTLNAADSFNTENMQLRYALIEKETDVENEVGQINRNAVIAQGNLVLSEILLNTNLAQEINIPAFDFNYPAIVVWVQKILTPYDREQCTVEYVEEYLIEL